jgi:beta-N-acetylhexosaminidase
MDMHGARTSRGFESDVVDAFLAGADLILVSQANADRHRAAASALVDAVEDGRIPLKRLNKSVERVMALKESLPVLPSPAPAMVGGSTHRAVVEDAARASITVVRNGVLPLRPQQKVGALTFQQKDRLTPVESDPDGDAFLSEASGRGFPVRRLPMKAARDEVDSILAWATALDAVVVGARRLAANPSQAVAVARLSEVVPVVLLALREPYDLGAFVGADALVACYGDQEGQVKAALDVIFGKTTARGKLPVIIPDLAESTLSLS